MEAGLFDLSLFQSTEAVTALSTDHSLALHHLQFLIKQHIATRNAYGLFNCHHDLTCEKSIRFSISALFLMFSSKFHFSLLFLLSYTPDTLNLCLSLFRRGVDLRIFGQHVLGFISTRHSTAALNHARVIFDCLQDSPGVWSDCRFDHFC